MDLVARPPREAIAPLTIIRECVLPSKLDDRRLRSANGRIDNAVFVY